ncbi:head GIN domain-containing protein [Chitinimonas naiadis]
MDNDDKSGDVKNIHVSIGSIGGVQGNGKMASETRPLKAFTVLDSSGAIDVEARIGDTPSLTVEGDENLLQYIQTAQVGDKLVISTKRSFSSKQTVKVIVVTPSLRELKHTGSGDVQLAGLNGGDLQVESTGSGETQLSGKLGALTLRMVGSGDFVGEQLSPASVKVDVLGSGDVRLGKVEVDSFEATVKGSGSIAAEGKTKSLKGSVMGSGDLKFEELRSQTAELELMGSGDITAYASESVSANARGSGDIVVHGKPAKQDFTGKHVSLAS